MPLIRQCLSDLSTTGKTVLPIYDFTTESRSSETEVLITGQEMPTADIALFSRVIFLESQKSERSKEETDKYKIYVSGTGYYIQFFRFGGQSVSVFTKFT